MNRDYQVVAKQTNFVIDRVKGDTLSGFSIERARLRSIWYFLAIAVVSVAGYGWSLHSKTVSFAFRLPSGAERLD